MPQCIHTMEKDGPREPQAGGRAGVAARRWVAVNPGAILRAIQPNRKTHLGTEIKATKVGGALGQQRPANTPAAPWATLASPRAIQQQCTKSNIRSPQRHEGLGDGAEARSHTHRRDGRTPPHKQARKQRKKETRTASSATASTLTDAPLAPFRACVFSKCEWSWILQGPSLVVSGGGEGLMHPGHKGPATHQTTTPKMKVR
jgi:hypothetical protein